jgi:hypothetical protein
MYALRLPRLYDFTYYMLTGIPTVLPLWLSLTLLPSLTSVRELTYSLVV